MHIVINASAVSAVKGGASFYIVNITRALALAKNVHTITILCTKAGAPYFRDMAGVDRCIDTAPGGTLARLVWEQFLLPRLCRSLHADLLFSPNYTMPLFMRKVKNAVTIHDLSFFPLSALYPRSRRLFKPIIRLSVRRADAVIAVSERTKADIATYIGAVPAKKTTVVYNAADDRFTLSTPDAVAAVKQRFGIDKEYILFTGFLEPRKNLKRLITAFGKICDRIPHDLVIAGGNGWWFEDLPDTVNAARVKERIRFLGYVPDDCMQALYAGADLFAFVSLYEGFGIAALEALSCGTPVLASNNTALPEVVGDAGVYADPYDIDDIAEKLCCVNDRKAMHQLRNRCAAVAARFSWHRAAEQMMSLFESTVAAEP